MFAFAMAKQMPRVLLVLLLETMVKIQHAFSLTESFERGRCV
jgi:hypothetical protein